MTEPVQPRADGSAPGRPRVAVIGGGIGGLTAARALRAGGDLDVVVYEAGDRPGGVLRTSRADGYLREHACNAFLSTPGGAVDLCAQLGVPIAQAAPAAKHRWIYRNRALHALPTSPRALIATELVSRRGKLRALAEPFRPRRARTSGAADGAGDDESVLSFARRRLGDEVAEAIIAPFVVGVFAGDAAALSVRAAFPRLEQLEQSGGLFVGLVRGMLERQFAPIRARVRARLSGRGDDARVAPNARQPRRRRTRPRLTAPVGGVQALVDALAGELDSALVTGREITAITADSDSRLAVQLADGGSEPADAAVLATPADIAARLVAASAPALAALLDAIPYVPAAVVHLGFARADVPHPLDGFGFLVCEGEPVRVLGCVFESALWPDRAPDGCALLRCIYGGARDPDVLALTDDQLIAQACADLGQVLGVSAAPSHAHVVRWPRAIAQYPLGHAEHVGRAQALARSRGLVLAGAAYHGVAVNSIAADAARVAASVRSLLAAPEATG